MHFNFIKWFSHWWIRRDHGDGDDGDVDVSDFADLATGCVLRLEEAASSQTLYGSPSVTLTPPKRHCKPHAQAQAPLHKQKSTKMKYVGRSS